MNKLYTVVGRAHFKMVANGKKVPIIFLKEKEHILDVQEFILWSLLYANFLTYDKLREQYMSKEKQFQYHAGRTFDECLCRLLQRGIAAEGAGETAEDALHDLLANLCIIPISQNLFLRLWCFIRLCVILKFPVSFGKKIFEKDKRTADENKVMKLCRQIPLSAAEIVKCIEVGKLSFSCTEELLDTLYQDEYTTSDNIADMVRPLSQYGPVMTAIANLYLRRQIVFERI